MRPKRGEAASTVTGEQMEEVLAMLNSIQERLEAVEKLLHLLNTRHQDSSIHSLRGPHQGELPASEYPGGRSADGRGLVSERGHQVQAGQQHRGEEGHKCA